MHWQKKIPVGVVFCILKTGCGKSPQNENAPSETVANVVTEDIQAGIEHHIEEQTQSE